MAHATEEEQIEAIKKWWQENGKAVIAGLVIGTAVLFGGKYWKEKQESLAQSASTEYEAIVSEFQKNNDEVVKNRGNELISTYPESLYATMTALLLAKQNVENGDLAAAHERLQWVLDNAKQDEIKHVARVRLARVLLAQGQAEQGLVLLNSVDPGVFKPSYEEARGDIQAALNNPEAALTAYSTALAAMPENTNPQNLQMKIDNLGLSQ